MRNAFVIATAILLAACVHGTRIGDFRPAISPEGAQVQLRLKGERTFRKCELFAVDSAGMIVLADRLVHVRWDRLRSIDFVQLGTGYDAYNGKLDVAQRERIALVSRFPQGLSGPLLAQVLATLHQDAASELP